MNRSRALSLLYAAPFLAAALWLFAPVVAGRDTLFLRDALNTHLEMKWFQAEAMRAGELPLVDPYRSGGQPHLGNPNTVPLYPDNLLYLLASPIWALNAHFWLHFLLAPLSVYYLGRQAGLGRAASWAAGVIYATGGYCLSVLSLYNLSASTTLAPAFLGACVATGRAAGGPGAEPAREPGAQPGPETVPDPGRATAFAAVLWALLVLGGDPMTAVAALVVGAATGIAVGKSRARAAARLAVAVALGTLVAAPQVVEFLRIAPGSYRGVQGYSPEAATAASWSPANLFEWLVPMAFGRPDLLYWGERFHAGRMPLFHSCSPGVLALALALAGSRWGIRWTKRWIAWSWALVAIGLFFAMGSYNPLAAWLLALPGMQIFRLPVKLWFLVACGLALLAGGGLQRFIESSGGAELRRWLVVLLAACALLGGGLILAGDRAAQLIDGLMPPRLPSGHAGVEAARWARLSLLSAGLLTAALGVTALARRSSWLGPGRRAEAGALLLGLHVVGQLVLLRGLVPTDAVEAYTEPPAEVLRAVPAEGRIVHGDASSLFGPVGVDPSVYPDADLRWLQRDTFAQLYPPGGVMAGRRYDFWSSPEGLDSFLTRAAGQAITLVDDPRRVSLLESSGVSHLLLTRDLEGVAAERAVLAAKVPAGTSELRVYELPRATAEVAFVGRVLRAPEAPQALLLLTDPTFEPRSAVVLADSGAPTLGGRGEARVIESRRESLRIEVRAESPGAVLVQRSYLPIYTAELDGQPVEIAIANLHRMAVEVGPGEHLLEIRVDRRALGPSFAVSALGLLLVALRARRASPGAAADATGGAGP
jgi:hypothetical protein